MIPVLVILVAAVVVLAFLILRLRSQTQFLRRRFELSAPYLIRSGAPFQEIEPLVSLWDWKIIAEGGNVKAGKIGNLDSCPCQSEYTVANNQAIINAWPNPQQVAACNANPPPPAAAEWKCTDDCVQVMTHVWRGWDVVQNKKNGQLRFNCYTFAQYHCKKPNDPECEKPPKPWHPDDPEIEP